MKEIMNIDNIIKTMIILNPYPEDLFSEPTKDEYDKMKEVLKNNGSVLWKKEQH